MTDRACKTCRWWKPEPDQFTKTGRLKKDATSLCRYPVTGKMAMGITHLPYALQSWLIRKLGERTDCGYTSKDDGISCATWEKKHE